MKTIIKILTFLALVSITSAFDLSDTMSSFKETEEYLDGKVEELKGFINDYKEDEWVKEKREWKLVIGSSFYTNHLCTTDMFEDNQLRQVSVQYHDYILSYNHFINSYNQDSHLLLLEKRNYIKKSNFYTKLGVGIVKGYQKKGKYIYREYKDNNITYQEWITYNNKFVIYKDFGLLAQVGLGYSIYDIIDVELNLFGEAIIMGVKVRI